MVKGLRSHSWSLNLLNFKNKEVTKMDKDIGKYSLLLGLLAVVLFAFWDTLVAGISLGAILILILGLLIGALQIKDRDATAFIVAVLGLALGAGLVGAVSVLGVQLAGWVNAILGNLIALVGAASLIVAGKAAYLIASK